MPDPIHPPKRRNDFAQASYYAAHLALVIFPAAIATQFLHELGHIVACAHFSHPILSASFWATFCGTGFSPSEASFIFLLAYSLPVLLSLTNLAVALRLRHSSDRLLVYFARLYTALFLFALLFPLKPSNDDLLLLSASAHIPTWFLRLSLFIPALLTIAFTPRRFQLLLELLHLRFDK